MIDFLLGYMIFGLIAWLMVCLINGQTPTVAQLAFNAILWPLVWALGVYSAIKQINKDSP